MGKGSGVDLYHANQSIDYPRRQSAFNPIARASSAPSLAVIDSEYGFDLRPLSADIRQLVS